MAPFHKASEPPIGKRDPALGRSAATEHAKGRSVSESRPTLSPAGERDGFASAALIVAVVELPNTDAEGRPELLLDHHRGHPRSTLAPKLLDDPRENGERDREVVRSSRFP